MIARDGILPVGEFRYVLAGRDGNASPPSAAQTCLVESRRERAKILRLSETLK